MNITYTENASELNYVPAEKKQAEGRVVLESNPKSSSMASTLALPELGDANVL